MKYIINCTFGFFGTKVDALLCINKPRMIFEVDEFEGTDEEYHSGVFTDIIDTNNDIMDAVVNYIKENDLIGECFSIKVDGTNDIILTEEDFTNKLMFV